MRDQEPSNHFPSLARGVRWGNTTLTGCRLISGKPESSRLQSVNMVPFVGDRVLVIASDAGKFLLPGGTIELGENLRQTIDREMLEETGYAIDTCHPFAILECFSHDAKPWREHLAHPGFERLLCLGDVSRIGMPQNPVGAERIVRVECLSLPGATQLFRAADRPELADIYTVAATIHRSRHDLPGLSIDDIPPTPWHEDTTTRSDSGKVLPWRGSV